MNCERAPAARSGPPRGELPFDPGRLFPLTYGIGAAGLPQSAAPARRALAKQLKAYLMFYDQLLANQFAQLANVGKLFSCRDETPDTNDADGADDSYHAYHSYFSQVIPDDGVLEPGRDSRFGPG
jgi:hypothetical protein